VVDPGAAPRVRGLAHRHETRASWVRTTLFTPFLEDREWRAFELDGRRVAAAHGEPHVFTAATCSFPGPRISRSGWARASRAARRDPVRLHWASVRETRGAVAGTVLHVDRFGNLVTSIRAEPSSVRRAQRAAGGPRAAVRGTTAS